MRIFFACFFLVAFLVPASYPAGRFTTADSVYYWFACRQSPEGPVIPEQMDSFNVKEQALSAIVFTLRGHYHRAARVLYYFERLKRKSGTGFNGFFTNYQLNGEPLSSEVSAESQLWLVNAAAQYAKRTEDKRILKFARELASKALNMEGPEGGIAAGFIGNTPISYMKASDNILASSVFSGLWNTSQSSEFRFAAYRSCRFINVFLSDPKTGRYRASTSRDTVYDSDQLDALLAFEDKKASWKNISGGASLENREKLALHYALLGEQDKSEELMNDIAANLIFSGRHLGAAWMPSKEGARSPDITVSAWYLFATEGFNPFPLYPAAWNDTDHYFETAKKFTGDDFETGAMKTMLVYSIARETNFVNRPRLDWAEDSETQSGVIRIFLPEKPTASPATIQISRQFLEPQDFSSVSRFKFWIKGIAGPGADQPNLKVNLAVTDADGELWISREVTFFTRFKFTNNLPFTAGWEKTKDSPPGNNLLDFEAVKELSFIISQLSENSWDISIDNLELQ